jgi:hypothetical protein
MPLHTVREIEHAIEKLSTAERQELCSWLNMHYPRDIDSRIESDLAAGHLDSAVSRALTQEEAGQVRELFGKVKWNGDLDQSREGRF